VIFYVGDIHGRVDDVAAIDRAAIKAGVDIIVQVGDFGIRWSKDCPITKYFMKRERQGRVGPIWYTCGGNHDNWKKWGHLQEKQSGPGCAIDASKTVELAPGCFYVTRGTVLDLAGKKHLFFGGAESTDKLHRVEGVSWWAEETPSAAEFNTFFDSMDTAAPEVVVTHDAPICVEINRINRDTNPTPKNLQNVLDHCDHAPVDWYFGHHHVLQDWQIKGINFHCCGFHGEYKEGRNG
jgi:predicted phosphodiesterase